MDVAQTRIVRTITPEDQLRLVDRYATQLAGGAMTARGSASRYARALFDVALKESADLDAMQQQLSGLSALVAQATRRCHARS